MADFQTLLLDRQGHILTVTLNRVGAGNAISMQMVNELSEVMDDVEVSEDISVFVLRGATNIFTTGIDLRDFAVDKRRDVYGLQKWEQIVHQLENLNKFTVAAVQGECVGGGVQLLLACDARIAAETATFCLNEVKLGFLPGMATYRLAKYVGLGRAKHLMLTGKTVSAKLYQEWGLLDGVYEAGEFEPALADTIESLLPFHPDALQLARRLLLESYSCGYEDFLGHFLAAQHRAVNSEAFGRLVTRASQSSDDL